MYCIVKATTNQEHVEYRVEYAIFEITPTLITRINDLQAATALVKTSFEQPQALTFYDSKPIFFDPNPFYEDEEEFIEFLEIEVDEDYRIIDKQDLPISIERLEQCARRVDAPVLKMFGVCQDSINWSGFINHRGVTFDTALIKIADLKAIIDVPTEIFTCLSLKGQGPATAELRKFNTAAELQAYIDGVNDSWCEIPNDEGKFSLGNDILRGLKENHALADLEEMGIILPPELIFD